MYCLKLIIDTGQCMVFRRNAKDREDSTYNITRHFFRREDVCRMITSINQAPLGGSTFAVKRV